MRIFWREAALGVGGGLYIRYDVVTQSSKPQFEGSDMATLFDEEVGGDESSGQVLGL